MEYAELKIIVLNTAIVLLAYLVLYPRAAGSDFMKIAFYDIFATGTALVIAGSVFWGTGHSFSLLLFDANWFWFTLLTYLVIEIPVMSWYFKSRGVSLP